MIIILKEIHFNIKESTSLNMLFILFKVIKLNKVIKEDVLI